MLHGDEVEEEGGRRKEEGGRRRQEAGEKDDKGKEEEVELTLDKRGTDGVKRRGANATHKRTTRIGTGGGGVRRMVDTEVFCLFCGTHVCMAQQVPGTLETHEHIKNMAQPGISIKRFIPII